MDDRKSSTMSSIFIGSTLEKPNVELIINAVATILHSQMLEVKELRIFLVSTISGTVVGAETNVYIGHKLREVDPVGERPVLFL